MVTPRLLILLVGAVALCEASPARMFFDNARRNSHSLGTVATVDCSDREAVKFVAKTNANFRCVYPDHNSRSSVARNSADEPLIFGNRASDCSPGQVYDPQLRVCTYLSPVYPAGLQSASLTKEDPSACAPGTMFVPEIGMCLEVNKPKHIAPLQSGSLVIEDPKDEISSFASSHVASDCKSGEIYNSELSLCMRISKKKSDVLLPALNQVRESAENAPLEIQSFASSISSAADCKDGEMYVSEIDTCVEITPSLSLKSANLVRERPIRDSSSVNRPVTPKDCKENEIYVSEIGICLPHNPPSADRKPLVAGSLVHEETPRPVAVPDTPKTCDNDEIYVPEIGICVPHDRTKKPLGPPSSSSLVREPEKLEITAFETSMNKDECPTGTHFVSEIGLCL